MSKKNKRIQSLLRVYSRLNSPISGASDRATQSTYNRELIIDTMKIIQGLLADDGIFPVNADE